MKKKKRLLIVGGVVLIALTAILPFTTQGRNLRKGLLGESPIETYIGGACSCPSDEPAETVKLYLSKGESIEKIKEYEQDADCSVYGCSLPTLYELYR